MDNLIVGSNVPIKLKVSVQTESIPTTYGFLYNSKNDANPYSNIAPFNSSLDNEWKELDGGNPVNGKIFRVRTFFKFVNSFPNEETFNMAVKQIRDTYYPEISGGNPSPYQMSFTLDSFFDTKTCIAMSELELI